LFFVLFFFLKYELVKGVLQYVQLSDVASGIHSAARADGFIGSLPILFFVFFSAVYFDVCAVLCDK